MIAPAPRYATGIITCPRDPPSLHATIDSLLAAGFDENLSINLDHLDGIDDIREAIAAYRDRASMDVRYRYSPALNNRHVNYLVVANHPPGPMRNWYAGLSSMVDRFPFAQWFVLCEDDIEITAGVRTYIDEKISRGTLHRNAVLSLYTAAPNHRENFCGFHEVRAPLRTYGALAYLLSSDIARRIIADCPSAPPPNHNATDHIIGRWCKTNLVPYFCHSPSLVRHTSQVSTVAEAGTAACRQCLRFARSFDELHP